MRFYIFPPRWHIAATFFIFAAFVLSVQVFAQDPNEVVSSPQAVTLSDINAVQAYWTEDRMNNAKPMPLPTLSGPLNHVQGQSFAPSGPMVIAPSGGPGVAIQEADESRIEQLSNGVIEPLAGTFPFSFTRYRLFKNSKKNYRTFPYSTIGKLFFTIPGQGNFVCSGSVINSANNSVVWTAGHCVFTAGVGFHTNVLFAPARRGTKNLLGTWTANQLFTLVGWQNGLFEYDHGAIVVNPGALSSTSEIETTSAIANHTGFLGFIANIAREQQWSIHGYPQAPQIPPGNPPGATFTGNHHEICRASFAATDQPTGTGGVDPPTNGVGCDQTGGSSGGPLLIDFSGLGGQTNFINGNNSYRYTGPNPSENLKLYSPYFGDGAVNLRDAAQAVVVP